MYYIRNIMNINQIKLRFIGHIQDNKYRMFKFFISGSSAAIINLGLLYILVAYFQFNTRFLENIANALSMEISIMYNFILSRFWTWNDAKKEYGPKLLVQCISFHLAVGFSIGIRLIMFPILQFFGVHYIINAIIGIGTAAVVNYILYDRIIFKKRRVPSYE